MAFKKYLLMIRLPNLFTIPSNIIVGYFTVLNYPSASLPLVLPLIVISSCLIYVAAIIFNDFFDIETDLKEGRARPLSAGLVTKKTAVTLGILCLIAALVLSAFGGVMSLIVSSTIVLIALLYDYKLKRTRFRAISVAAARASNIIYGASPLLLIGLSDSQHLQRLTVECGCMFLYVVATMMISAGEASRIRISRKRLIQPFFLILLVILIMIISVIFGAFKIDLLLNLVLLILIIGLFTYRRILRAGYGLGNEQIQSLVKILVLCLVLLDSAFASGVSGAIFGMLVALFLVPSFILSRLLYMT